MEIKHENKVCPFMSRPILGSDGKISFIKCRCLEYDCEAWESHKPVDEYDTFVGGRCRLIK